MNDDSPATEEENVSCCFVLFFALAERSTNGMMGWNFVFKIN